MSLGARMRDWFSTPETATLAAFVLVPLALVGLYWFGGAQGFTGAALGLPLCWCLYRVLSPADFRRLTACDPVTGLMLRPAFDTELDRHLRQLKSETKYSACILIDITNLDRIRADADQASADHVARIIANRLSGTLRLNDTIARLGDRRFGICLEPVASLDLEDGVQIAGRLQAVIEDPVHQDGATHAPTCAVGVRLVEPASDDGPGRLIASAHAALQDAQRDHGSAIRMYTPALQRRHDEEKEHARDISNALTHEEIEAWFQPQVSTDTGQVSGFEALARWRHPQKGVLSPGLFLPIIERQGRLQDLSMLMMRNALSALRHWDEHHHDVPRVSLNVASQDLRDPGFADRVSWELDRWDIPPERLGFEVLETVAADTSQDDIVRTVEKLHGLGCQIDLDDYGTGPASMLHLKRLPVHQIKIDRSFVMNVDKDHEQQRVITALLSMADQLGISTVAEGVETPGEYSMLSLLGCGHVQGFCVGKPMPLPQTFDWLTRRTRQSGASLSL